jgi:trimethylamine--corrinoid protein Co-methyltransferase
MGVIDMRIRSTFLTDHEIALLHQGTLRVLENSGVEINQSEALEVFRNHGLRVEGKRVFIDEASLWKALKTVPDSFILSGRTQKDDVLIGNGRTVYAPASGPVYVQRRNERRMTTCEDYVDLLKIFQSMKEIPVVNANMTEPQDLEFEERDAFRLKECLRLTTKPLMGFTTGKAVSERCIKIIRDFYNDASDCYRVMGVISPVSPLCFDESMLEGMMAYAAARQPLLIASCSLPGASSPVTIAGSLVTNNAEVLTGVVLSQLLCPGLPVIYGGTTTACDMRMVSPAIGSPETGLFTYGVRGLSAYYGLPCRSGGSLTDAKLPDMQAGIESTYSLLSAAIAGVDFVLQSCGILESFNSICFEKIIADEENIRMANRYVNGFEVNEETLVLDLIDQIGPGGTFIGSDHTFEHFKDDFLQADLMSKEGYEPWVRSGKKDLFESAAQKADSIIANYKIPELSETQIQYLNGL